MLFQQNILISEDDGPRALLSDFGISLALFQTTTTASSGTVRWMAKELLDRDVQDPDKESDIWALGMVIYVR